jgi:hypothetical protein
MTKVHLHAKSLESYRSRFLREEKDRDIVREVEKQRSEIQADREKDCERVILSIFQMYSGFIRVI